MHRFQWIFIALFALLLNGCGGGGGGSTSTGGDAELNGLAAIGAPLNGASVEIKGKNGNVETTVTFTDGTFSKDVSALTPPFVVKVTDSEFGVVLFSYSEDVSRVNVTPVTTLIMSQAASSNGQTLADLFADFVSLTITTFEDAMNDRISALNALLDRDGFSDFNHFGGTFTADSTGYDGILDEIVHVSGSSVVLVDENGTAQVSTPFIHLQGRVLSEDNSAISTADLTITATDSLNNEVEANIQSDGIFSVNLSRDKTYSLTISADGYSDVTIEGISTDTQDVTLSLGTIFLTEEVAPVTVTGSVIDATADNTVIEGADITIRAGQNNEDGASVGTVSTNASGEFELNNIDPGYYTFEVAKSGFYTQYETRFINSENTSVALFLVPQTDSSDSLPITETPVITSMTITLQWLAEPIDLDVHLTGPKAELNDRFRVAFNNDCWADTELDANANCDGDLSAATAFLDRDDVDGYGPETVQLQQMTDGSYKFYVHQSGILLGSGEGSISGSSQAVVKVIDNFGRTFTFQAPVTGGDGENDIWHVFSTDENGTPISVGIITAHGSDTTGSLD